MIDEATRVMNAPDRTLLANAGLQSGSDPMRTQMGGSVVCPVCKAVAPLMETYCPECGYLVSAPLPETAEMPETGKPFAELVDSAEGRRYPVQRGVNTIGRQDADILLLHPTVSRLHARITVEENTVTLEDLGSTNNTRINDQKLAPNLPSPVPEGAMLRFGDVRLVLEKSGEVAVSQEAAMPTLAMTQTQLPETPVSSAAPPSALLRWQEGPGSDIPLSEGVITLGRRPDNSYPLLNDAYISGRHAEISVNGQEVVLTDVGSTNGTQVNGQKLAAHMRTALAEGDIVQLGQTRYEFVLLQLPVDQPDSAEAEEEENNSHD